MFVLYIRLSSFISIVFKLIPLDLRAYFQEHRFDIVQEVTSLTF